MHDVFVSYSVKDKVVADSIVATLERNSIRCWYAPRDIKPGADWGKAISNAIKASRFFILVFSNHANRSQRVLDELNFAISCEAIIIPFRIENLEPSDAMMLHLSSRHWLDAYDPSWKEYLTKLVQTISSGMGSAVEAEAVQVSRSEKIPTQTSKRLVPFVLVGLLAVILGIWGISQLSKITSQTTPTAPAATPPPVTPSALAVAPPTITPSPIPTIDQTLRLSLPNDTLNLDPQLFQDVYSNMLVENLFLTLTRVDPETGKVVPEAAKSWSISPDGLFYTFTIRDDIPWVNHPLGGKTEPVKDDSGNIRYLSAHDFVDTIYRVCQNGVKEDSLSGILIPIIKGCQPVNEYPSASDIPPELLESIGVKAISQNELLIELESATAYFLTETSMNSMAAVPYWTVNKYGEAWKNPGVIITNGYYVIDEFQLGESLLLKHNEYLPPDLFGGGNIGTIEVLLGKDPKAAYALWLDGRIDFAEIPMESIRAHLQDYPNETGKMVGNLTAWIEFNRRKAPFNNVHARRAFAAALDKAAYTQGYSAGVWQATNQISIPGIVGAPGTENLGLEYDPALAKRELGLAGYPDCTGFPIVKIKGAPNRIIGAEYIRAWEKALGCPENTISADFSNLSKEGADMFVIGWALDYPDANNLFGDLLSCESIASGGEFLDRDCDEIDTMIFQAQVEINPEKRTALYVQIEQAFFGPEGSFPLIPFYLPAIPFAVAGRVQEGAFWSAFNTWSVIE